MNKEYFDFFGEKDMVYTAVIWLPEDKPKSVLQIVHGMTEHIERYERLAEVLTAKGIAVAGYDLRGHGRNSPHTDCASFGEGGWDLSIREIHQFHGILKARFLEAEHYIMGFSLGSFLLREYFSTYNGENIDGAIIMGTGQQPPLLLSLIMRIVKGQIKKAGFDVSTDLIRNLSFGTYNKKFSPVHTRADWLCSDPAELDKYPTDDLCKADISAGLFWQLLDAMKRLYDCNTYLKWKKDLPVLLLSGGCDPVGDAGKGVKLVCNAMKKSGLQKVSMKLYSNGRHDILHEEASGIAMEVRIEITNWILGESR